MIFRHVTPVPPDDATGQVAAVYDQVDAEFSTIGPAVMMLSKAPELLVPGWALLRESLVAGTVPRWRKEVVTVTVSRTNQCAYDTAGHLVFLRLAGGSHVADALERGDVPDEVADLVRWARSGGTRPFTSVEAPEFIGTALALHFVNRLVHVLLAGDLLPGAMKEGEPGAFDGAPIARAIQRQRTPGESLRLLTEVPASVPSWAGDSPVGPAYVALRNAATRGGGLLSEPARKVVVDTIRQHDGLRGDRGWLAESLEPLTPEDRPGAALAILAGVAPSKVTTEDVASWRGDRFSEHCLLHLLAYGAITAVSRVEAGY
ncbi:carboxymuconolactone decarboxylase family protein [Actinophytocola sp.]|uniref:carboxymuconolactone decarboxylase family protein n=1 Tax=Actinophytocola sp. TaxID=1872138 RepID=UPI002ED06675